jgi:hypothetical protein
VRDDGIEYTPAGCDLQYRWLKSERLTSSLFQHPHLSPPSVPYTWIGQLLRRSLNTGNWTAASTIVHQWQSSGRIGVLKPELPSVTAAVEQFLEEAAVRNLAATTIKKRRELLEGKLLPSAPTKGSGNYAI